MVCKSRTKTAGERDPQGRGRHLGTLQSAPSERATRYRRQEARECVLGTCAWWRASMVSASTPRLALCSKTFTLASERSLRPIPFHFAPWYVPHHLLTSGTIRFHPDTKDCSVVCAISGSTATCTHGTWKSPLRRAARSSCAPVREVRWWQVFTLVGTECHR